MYFKLPRPAFKSFKVHSKEHRTEFVKFIDLCHRKTNNRSKDTAGERVSFLTKRAFKAVHEQSGLSNCEKCTNFVRHFVNVRFENSPKHFLLELVLNQLSVVWLNWIISPVP